MSLPVLSNRYADRDALDLNPGQKIKAFLENEYHPNNQFLSKIDSDLCFDNELLETMYQSTLSYTLRRLVCSAHFIQRTYQQHGDGRVKSELRSYLKNYTRYAYSKIDMLVSWLLECVINSKDDFNNSHKKIARKQVEHYNWNCYICGREMELAAERDVYNSITADHNWPRMLGGESEIGNLRFACKDCNNKYKKDFLNYSDYHYEQITFVVNSYTNYQEAKNRSYEAAVFAKTNFCCIICNQPAYKIGELFIGRNDLSDSFHFFNLSAYCSIHKPE